MALRPCDDGAHRHPLRNSYYYLALVGPADESRRRLRLCPSHSLQIQNDLSEYEVDPVNGALRIPDNEARCFSCHQPALQGCWNVFVTGYPAKDEREDYWTRVHIDCSLPRWVSLGEPV